MMTITPEQKSQIERICSDKSVARLAVFGSRARGQESVSSDLDLLIEFVPGHAPGLLALAKLAESFSIVFGGLPVDLRTPRDLSKHFREDAARSAEVIFAAR